MFVKSSEVDKFLNRFGKTDLIYEVDGNITCENAILLKEIGADLFVAGTSSIFKGNHFNLEETKRFLSVVR